MRNASKRFWVIVPLLVAALLLGVGSAVARPPSDAGEPLPLAETFLYSLDSHTEAAKLEGESEMAAVDMEADGLQMPQAPTTPYTITLRNWRNLRPTESYLRGVSMVPEIYQDQIDCTVGKTRRGWIVGEAGVILGYCHGVWDHVPSPYTEPNDLYGVQTISPTLAVAVGDGGSIVHYAFDTTTQGYVWSKYPIQASQQRLYSVSLVKTSGLNQPDRFEGWAVGDQNQGLKKATLVRGVIQSPNRVDDPYNYNWKDETNQYDLPDASYLYQVQTLAANAAWAVGGLETKTGVTGYIYHWDGTTWRNQFSTSSDVILGLYMLSPDEGWASGTSGGIYHYQNGAWSAFASPFSGALLDIGLDKEGWLWVVGMDGQLARYDTGPQSDHTWQPFTDLRTDAFDFAAVDFNSDRGWMVGFDQYLDKGKPVARQGGQILEFTADLEGQKAWLAVTPPTNNRLNDVAAVTDNDAWAVGTADDLGPTLLHWDGSHWQRWFQKFSPLPKVNLSAIDMVSATEGWAAAEPIEAGAAALMLRWDGQRWFVPRDASPINGRINAIDMLDKDFGWLVADAGSATGVYNGATGYWTGLAILGNMPHRLLDVAVIAPVAAGPILGVDRDAWAVGTSEQWAYWLRFLPGAGGNRWQDGQSPEGCRRDNSGIGLPPTDGPTRSTLRGIALYPDSDVFGPGPWGYTVGNYFDRSTIYKLNPTTGGWDTFWCDPINPQNRFLPSAFNTVDFTESNGVAWVGGYRTIDVTYGTQIKREKRANIGYLDGDGYHWAGIPIPLNGWNIFHRPISAMSFSSEMMGWAVGEAEDTRGRNVIYQYPYPNFTIASEPEVRAVRPGQIVEYNLAVSSMGGMDTNVSLDVFSKPTGVNVTLSSSTINNNMGTTISVSTAPSLAMGEYQITMRARADYWTGDVYLPIERHFKLRLIVTPYPVSAVMPDHGVAGTEVTILGDNFGGSAAGNEIWLAGSRLPAEAILAWSNSSIRVRMPTDSAQLRVLFPDGPQAGKVQVIIGGVESNANLTFQAESQITHITGEVTLQKVIATVHGTLLGPDPGSMNRSTIWEHLALGNTWIDNAKVTSWSASAITFETSVRTPQSYLRVTSNGYESNPLVFNLALKDIYLPSVLKNFRR